MASQKWKSSERRIAQTLQRGAGRVTDLRIANLVTCTGRVGHLVALGFDILVGEGRTALCGEAKRRKVFLGAEAVRALLQIVEIAHKWQRTPVLGFTLADDVPTFIGEKGKRVRVPRDWVALPLEYAEELLAARRFLEEVSGDMSYGGDDFHDWRKREAKALTEEEEELDTVSEL